jgi:KipI family sensor histidine kinase inhibitor
MMAGAAEREWELSRDGDAAMLLAFPERLDPAVNARCVAVAEELRRRRIPGVRDVVEAFATVAVHFDPLLGDVDEISTALSGLAAETAAPSGRGDVRVRREIRLPVCYGGASGPDLADVARFARCSEAEVVERHCGAPYRVYMLGFQPGFAYLGALDPRIAAPRRAVPRVHVPAGSVGIAARQTGVYPVASPGGWQLVGQTPVRLFDMARRDPFLLSAGDLVRFEPIDEAAYGRLETGQP